MDELPEHKHKSLLLAKILRQLLADERFETLADVKDALKTRCARLRIRYVGAEVDRALELVGSNHPLAAGPKLLREIANVVEPSPREISKQEAREMLAERGVFLSGYGRPLVPRAMVVAEGAPEDFPTLMEVTW